MGSKLVTAGPKPRVLLTMPPKPAPAPAAPALVPPGPVPTVDPRPPVVPPGVFCTTPKFVPRNVAPALVRRMSVSAMLML